MRRKIVVTPANVIFYYDPQTWTYNRTRNDISTILGVNVTEYYRSRMMIDAADVNRLSVETIKDRIESTLNTKVPYVTYSYKVTIFIPKGGFPVKLLGNLRQELEKVDTTEMTYIQEGNRLIINIRNVPFKTPRQLEVIVRNSM